MFESHMKLAIEKAKNHHSIYGAVLAMGDQVAVAMSDASPGHYDPTGHAIMQALRELGAITHEKTFEGYSLYTTTEPCPMCATACVLTQLESVYYGIPFEDLPYPPFPTPIDIEPFFNKENTPELVSGILEEECKELL
jgi:tRNA(Arg) A34 adenosine deaminase TadA